MDTVALFSAVQRRELFSETAARRLRGRILFRGFVIVVDGHMHDRRIR